VVREVWRFDEQEELEGEPGMEAMEIDIDGQ